MKDFPEFMKSRKNRISSNAQNTKDIEGFYYTGANGNQMAFWTCHADRTSKKHTHEFDEYMVCVFGRYTVIMNDIEYVLNPGDEILIPKGTEQWGKCIAGTRTPVYSRFRLWKNNLDHLSSVWYTTFCRIDVDFKIDVR